jgi:hypothetical protein
VPDPIRGALVAAAFAVAVAALPSVAAASPPQTEPAPATPALDPAPHPRVAPWARSDEDRLARLRQAARMRNAGMVMTVAGPSLGIFSIAAGIGARTAKSRAWTTTGVFAGGAATIVGPVLLVGSLARASGTLPPSERSRSRALLYTGMGTWIVGAVAVPTFYMAAPVILPAMYLTGAALVTIGTYDAIARSRAPRAALSVGPTLLPGGGGLAMSGAWGP